MKIVTVSKPATVLAGSVNQDPIHVFTQFFIHRDPHRQRELRFCLKQVALHPDVYQLHLLGERIYTDDELGVQTDKIVQTNIGRRLRFQDVFEYIRREAIQGYYILINSDICFDPSTLVNLRTTDIHQKREMFALLRFEYNAKNPGQSRLFGPRADSQDTWIFHSNFPIPKEAERAFHFEFGKPGCDNKIVYLAQLLGYEVINDPMFIRTYHVHTDMARDYTIKDQVRPPWGVVIPARIDPAIMPSTLGIHMPHMNASTRGFSILQYTDNERLYEYIRGQIEQHKTFIIPQIVGIETVAVVLSKLGQSQEFSAYISSQGEEIATASGVRLTSLLDGIHFSSAYYTAFEKSDVFCAWDIQSPQCLQILQSHEHIKSSYSKQRPLWASTMEIYNYLYATNPWTTALRGQRILLVSPWNINDERIADRASIWRGVDILPECPISTLTVNSAQFTNRPVREAMVELTRQLADVADTYDVALIACGGFSNPLCVYLYSTGKSAIHVGDPLSLWFGISNARWLAERPDVLRIYMNPSWTRQSTHET